MKKLFIFTLILLVPWVAIAGTQQTSGTTGTDMIALVRADYNDTTSSYFSASEMLEFLNDGVLDISIKSRCYQAQEAISLISSQIEYSITTAYTDVVAVQYNDGTNVYALKKGDPSFIGLKIDETDIDAPTFWYEFDGKIGVYPVLSSVTSESVTVYLVGRPSPIVAGSAIPTPAIYDIALKYYMLSRMALKDKNMAFYAALVGQYSQELGLYRKDLNTEDAK